MKQVIITVCWACKKGGEAGPLRKVGKDDYVHEHCGGKPPLIGNSSFVKENRLEAKDIEMLKQQMKEANDKTI